MEAGRAVVEQAGDARVAGVREGEKAADREAEAREVGAGGVGRVEVVDISTRDERGAAAEAKSQMQIKQSSALCCCHGCNANKCERK